MFNLLETERGQSEVLGTVLLVGVVTMAVGTALYAGTNDFDTAKQGIGIEVAEHELKKLGGELEDVAVGNSPVKTVQLNLESGQTAGTTTIDAQRGQINVHVGGTDVYTGYLGVIRFEQGSASVAYQGGGVFREYPEGGAETAQVPSWSANNYSSPTLTIPLITIEGSGSPGTAVELKEISSQDKYPEKHVEPGENVVVTITSDYYEAWSLFFTDHLGVPEENVDVDDSVKQVTMAYGEGKGPFLHLTVYRVSVDSQ